MEQKEYYFTAVLANAVSRWRQEAAESGPQAMEDFDNWAASLVNEIEKYKTKIAKIASGRERAKHVHQLIDEADRKVRIMQPEAFSAVQCRKGCAACCHMPVAITFDEAQLLAAHVETKADRELLNEQANRGMVDEDKWWALPWAQKRCVFLDAKTRQCRVYEDRPIGCRKYLVISPPTECHKDSIAQVAVMPNLAIEAIATAAMDIERNFEYLPLAVRRAMVHTAKEK